MPLVFFRHCCAILLLAGLRLANAAVPTPQEHFGFAIGADYQLTNYTQTEAYFKKVAATSDRAKLVDIGRTEEGRTQWMMILSAPENLRDLERYREIAQKLARAEDLTETQARALAAEGKAVVWIDGGLHANETAATEQLIETVWQLASASDPEMLRILRDVIVLCVHANPDGHELVSNWYMREPVPNQRLMTATPRLYQKYSGHDNNRDFFTSAMKETTNLNRQLYLEWFPQVVYNHHQTGPVGTAIFVPPFRDPFNYVFDPMVVIGIETLGDAIQGRFLVENKPGATSRSGATYSAWWNGGLRTTAYFHNMIGLMTEVVGGPTPMNIPLIAARQLPSNDLVAPLAPQVWHFRQSIEYSLTANRAVLDYASRHRDALLYNIYRMGRNSIERGRTDHWTPRPSRLAEVARKAAAERSGTQFDSESDGDELATVGPPLAPKYFELLHRPEWRDPRGFIIPADQPDFPTAIKFINALLKTGIAVQRATADFSVAGHRYPAGSYVVKTDQAFRPHVLDMFEPQDHPNDFKAEGGAPIRPYDDLAGWTLAFEMGVKFDRVLDDFSGPFEKIPYGALQTPAAPPVAPHGAGFVVSHAVNDGFRLVNRLLQKGAEVFWLKTGDAFGHGAIYIPAHEPAQAIVTRTAAELGIEVRTVATPPTGEAVKLAPVRIALWDRFGGSIPAGWTRWALEQFEFPCELIYTPEVDAGNLREKYDAIIFVNGAIPAPGTRGPIEVRPRRLPPQYENQFGALSADRSVPALRDFLDRGGTVVTIGTSTALAFHLGLRVKNALVEKSADHTEHPLPAEKFYVPGSVLEARIDVEDPVAWGMPAHADFYFDRSPTFALAENAAGGKVKPVAWFDRPDPLRSGWAWGQKYLHGGVTVAVAPVGAGKLYLLGSEVAFRAQTHGTFKLLFNALHLATAKSATL